MKHTYRVALKELALSQKGAGRSLQFEFGSHDDVFAILERLSGNDALDEDTRAALIVGVKTLGSALLSNPKSPEMSQLLPHFKGLMMELKAVFTENP
ncbi:DUF3861 family protein [Desulfobaculum bizertense]|uniref:DUF3861 domain-containing protein n=1 Tax=Desulfobaculum bizertense DSM 18034 TaxID=1121442 RepID=A0A1T4WKK1_9BACT|nr:DUF3861 family protein [Desulfobaculum bizertense]SKA77719.1 protein of unknown function [Desulfobaculum bizertense DSM 18034]